MPREGPPTCQHSELKINRSAIIIYQNHSFCRLRRLALSAHRYLKHLKSVLSVVCLSLFDHTPPKRIKLKTFRLLSERAVKAW